MKRRGRARCHDQTAIRSACEGYDVALDVAGLSQVDEVDLNPKRLRHSLNGGKLGRSAGDKSHGVPKYRRSRHAESYLFEQFKPFPTCAEFETYETGGIAARPRQAVDQAAADGIGDI